MTTPPCPTCNSAQGYYHDADNDRTRCLACLAPAEDEPLTNERALRVEAKAVQAKAKAVAPPEPAKPATRSAGVRSKKQAAPTPARKR